MDKLYLSLIKSVRALYHFGDLIFFGEINLNYFFVYGDFPFFLKSKTMKVGKSHQEAKYFEDDICQKFKILPIIITFYFFFDFVK